MQEQDVQNEALQTSTSLAVELSAIERFRLALGQLMGRKGPVPGTLECRREVGINDRRRQSLWSLIYGGFRPRRRAIRRLGDGQAVILDWHDPGLLFLALAIVVMSCIDALFTLNLLTVGGEEINLFMRVLIEQDVSSFLQVKISVTAISVVVLVAASQYRVLGKLPVRRMLQAIFLVYGTLIAYEVVLLLGYFHDAVNTPPINF